MGVSAVEGLGRTLRYEMFSLFGVQASWTRAIRVSQTRHLKPGFLYLRCRDAAMCFFVYSLSAVCSVTFERQDMDSARAWPSCLVKWLRGAGNGR